MPEYRIGVLDIESDGLKADFSTMLSWAIKEHDGSTVVDVISKKDLFSGNYDKKIIQSLVNEIRKYKILVTYYGTGFDIPYIRSKALHYGIEFPSYAEIYNFDLYFTVKSKLKLSRSSLDSACDYLGIKGKTPIDKEYWRAAKYGDADALKEVLEHNIADVDITDKLYNKLLPFRKWIKTSI